MSDSPSDALVEIIDDDATLGQALSSLFRSVGLSTRVHASSREFLAAPRLDLPTCLVLDVRLPGMSGLDFQQQLTAQGLDLPVVLMTGHGDIPMSVRAMKAGAVDFLAKPFRDQDMLDAVSIALERDRAARAGRQGMAELQQRFGSLSPRERQVMAGVVRGLLNKQVAAELGLSEITVKIHRGQVMRKLGVRSLAELVQLAGKLNAAADRRSGQTTV